MKMPASFAEFSDALQKARIKDGSFCKNELTCIHYNGLTHAMIGWNANLYDLNLFAQRLASLTEEQKKGMDALLKIKQNHRVAPIPLNQLINLTYNTDICCFAPRVSNHEELGAFLYANEMLSNEAMALLDTTEEGSGFQERLLELLGEQHQEDHGGVFTDFGYAELGGEIKDIYVCQSNETACFHRSDAPVVLEVRKGFFNDPSYDNDKTAVLNLPAADAGIWRAVEKVDAASVDECAFRCVDCLIPFLRDAINNAIDDEDGIEQADEFAKRLAQIEREWPESDMVKYKALLSVVDHPSLQDATRLMGEIDQYELRPEVAQTWGYAEMMFREKYSALPEELFQTPQAAQIGQKMLDDRLGVITEYQNIGEDGFTEADHIRLRDALMRIEGKFLLSYNDDAFVRGLYDRPGIYLMETTRINNIKQRYDNGAQFPELLIANYDLRERSRAVPSQMTLFDWNGG